MSDRPDFATANAPDAADPATVEERVADVHPVDETMATSNRDPDAMGEAVGLNPDPEAPLATREELERRDRER